MDQKAILKSLTTLRNDALRRSGMEDAVIAYGWSAIRIGQEILGREMYAKTLHRVLNQQQGNISE